jgi:hypothetical protein
MSHEVSVAVTASMTEVELREFLQLIRDFDMKHDATVELAIMTVCPTMKSHEIQSIYESIRPPMKYSAVYDLDGTLRSENVRQES